MKSWFFLYVVVWKCSSIFKTFACENKSLLIWGNTFLVLDLGLHVFNCVRWLSINGDCFTIECLYKDLHNSTAKSEYKMESWFFLYVVVWKCSSIFKTFACENKSLLICRDTFFFSDFFFNHWNWVWGLNIKGYWFTSKALYEYLHKFLVLKLIILC